MTAMPDLLTVDETARELRVSKHTVYRLVSDGRLPSFRVGRQIRVSSRDVLLATAPALPLQENLSHAAD